MLVIDSPGGDEPEYFRRFQNLGNNAATFIFAAISMGTSGSRGRN